MAKIKSNPEKAMDESGGSVSYPDYDKEKKAAGSGGLGFPDPRNMEAPVPKTAPKSKGSGSITIKTGENTEPAAGPKIVNPVQKVDKFDHLCWGKPCDGGDEHDSGTGDTGGSVKSYDPKNGPSNEEKVANAEKMYGTGSKQHIAAIKKYGGGKKFGSVNARRKFSDGNGGVIGPLASSLALQRKAELAGIVDGVVAHQSGWCSLPGVSHVTKMGHDECTKKGGIWSPALIGGFGGRGFGSGSEESPAHEAGESAATEAAEHGTGSGSSSSVGSSSGAGSSAGTGAGGSGPGGGAAGAA